MGQTVMLLYLGKRKESWYQLTDDERNVLREKVHDSIRTQGGKVIASATCGWSTPDYDFFAVEEFPSPEALRAHFATEHEIGWPQHVDETYVVGIP